MTDNASVQLHVVAAEPASYVSGLAFAFSERSEKKPHNGVPVLAILSGMSGFSGLAKPLVKKQKNPPYVFKCTYGRIFLISNQMAN